jgi:lysine 2,3-aminomutase
MSHKTGKIEILGIFDDEIYFKYHQAKNRNNIGKIFTRPVDENAGWLDDLQATSMCVLDAAPYLL